MRPLAHELISLPLIGHETRFHLPGLDLWLADAIRGRAGEFRAEDHEQRDHRIPCEAMRQFPRDENEVTGLDLRAARSIAMPALEGARAFQHVVELGPAVGALLVFHAFLQEVEVGAQLRVTQSAVARGIFADERAKGLAAGGNFRDVPDASRV